MSYSPVLGRFIQRDPMRYVNGNDVYQYELSEVGRCLDPSGFSVTSSGRFIPWIEVAYRNVPWWNESGPWTGDGTFVSWATPTTGPTTGPSTGPIGAPYPWSPLPPGIYDIGDARKRLGLPDELSLHRGCIDLFLFLGGGYGGGGGFNPIVKCFDTQSEAEAAQPPYTNWRKSPSMGVSQGYPDPNITKRPDGSYPMKWMTGTDFNFAIRQPDGTYIFMDQGETGAPQHVAVKNDLPCKNGWTNKYCVFFYLPRSR